MNQTQSSSTNSSLAEGWNNDQKVGLAKALVAKDVILYYGNTCSHCHNQLEAFGSGVDFLKKIDCYSEVSSQTCTQEKIEGVPTWIYNGDRKEGAVDLTELAAWIGYTK